MEFFNKVNPLIWLLYFVFIFFFSFSIINPMILISSFIICSLLLIIFFDKKYFKRAIITVIPVIILTAIINPMFNHGGVTILFYLKSGNPVTKEALIFGIVSGAMIANVIIIFTLFTKIMTGDKIMYLFGKISPSLALIFSMCLGFVPKFKKEFESYIESGKSLDYKENKFKSGFKIFSAVLRNESEKAVDIANSMKGRGYGTGKRTFFTLYKFGFIDKISLIYILALGIYIIFGYGGSLKFTYFPFISEIKIDFYFITLIFAFILLLIYPLFLRLLYRRNK